MLATTDMLSRLTDVRGRIATCRRAVDDDAGASVVTAAVVREFDTKADKAMATADDARRDDRRAGVLSPRAGTRDAAAHVGRGGSGGRWWRAWVSSCGGPPSPIGGEADAQGREVRTGTTSGDGSRPISWARWTAARRSGTPSFA